ncbi:hypothetical protein BX611_2636 [Lutibacter oceani]|uniref:Uncharacterized protein n=1 Tax=Lutibacter oceani TaxID=1853311 RepID=A0A3D9RIR8_9FLAO|nr:hypothetical protein [Lutibacter oceani]REE79740.1 hypothetical protein BX611_2636 [Lutibacter oceani]
MSLKSAYRIIPLHNLIIEFHKGNLDVDSYIRFKQKTFNDKNFKTGLNYFIHFKNITFLAPQEDIEKFVNFIKNNAPKLGKRKVAFVTSTPNQVVKTTIYKTMLADNDQQVAVFSTNDNALNWLTSNPLNTLELIEVVKSLAKEVE